MGDGYRLRRWRSTAADFHARLVPEPALPEIWSHELTAPALVLGSTQPESIVDRDACARAGVDVVRRRSGGGAVLLAPGEVTWVDVIVPRDGVGWATDIHGPMRWIGQIVGDLVGDLVAERLPASNTIEVNDGPPRTTPWSSLICFDGVGVGEVVIDGAKLVGISQRRSRAAARLQCCWYSAYDPAALVALLAPSVRPPVDALAPVATLPADVADALVAALAARLA